MKKNHIEPISPTNDIITSENVKNSAIKLILEQLEDYLIPNLDTEYCLLNGQNATDKLKVFYELIYLPYCAEHRKHYYFHHNFSMPDNWYGEQACLSMIQAINQRAWWLLYYYTIKEAIEYHCKIQEEKADMISRKITSFILDGENSIAEAITWNITKELPSKSEMTNAIITETTEKINQYKRTPSTPITYR